MDKQNEAMWTMIVILVVIHLSLLFAGKKRVQHLFEVKKNEKTHVQPIYIWGKVAFFNYGSITVVGVLEVATYFVLELFLTENPLNIYICYFLGGGMITALAAMSITQALAYQKEERGAHRS